MADYKSEFTGAQIDAGIKKANTALQPSGGTMTGPLILSGDPASTKEAATKEYVDKHSAADAVQYVAQELTTDQQAVARTNIGAASQEEVDTLSEEIEYLASGVVPFEASGQFVSIDNIKNGDAIAIVGNLTNPYVDAIDYKVFHCGENLLNNSDMPNHHTVPITYEGNGWITFEVPEALTATKWVNAFYPYPWLPPQSKYKIYYELSPETNVTGTATMYVSSNNAGEWFATNLQPVTDFSTPGTYAAVVETKAADKVYTNMFLSRLAVGFSAGAYGKIKMRPWIVKVDDDTPLSTKMQLVYNVEYPGYEGEILSVSIPGSYSGTHDWGNVIAYEGVNTFSTAWGELTVSGERSTKDDTDAAAKLDVTQYGMPILFLRGSIAGMSKDNAVTLEYEYNGGTGSCTVKWQGSSSVAYPKKNYTIKFDNAFEAKEGWGEQKKYCFKANFMDHTHARNICSCKLWGEIVKSRANVPDELSSLPNGGAIDGFPCIIMLNGEFHGLYTWNIPKDGWMFGSPKAIVCADAHVDATKFKALATLDGDFDLEYAEDEDNTDWVLTSLNTAIQAVMDSDGSDLDTVVGQYIDIPSAIDYCIHTVDEGGLDGTDHNYLLVTFDGVKWYFGTYDRDRTYGIGWNNDDFLSPASGLTFAEFANIHRLMYLIKTYAKDRLKARAVELRSGIMSEANVYNVFVNFMKGFPTQVLDEDVRVYPTIPCTNVHNLSQILNWYRLRKPVIDAEVDAM